jgi:transposase-like protein
MLAFGPPANRQARLEWWRRQIQRHTDGNLSVAEFCRRLGVSTVSFYTWKRRFRETSAASALRSEKPTPQSTPTSDGLPTAAAFLPVSILDAGATGQLEIELANSCVVRLKGVVDPDLLRIAIRAAGRLGNGGRGTN